MLAAGVAGGAGGSIDHVEGGVGLQSSLRDSPLSPRTPSDKIAHTPASEITRLADTVVLLAEGKAIAVGDVESVMSRIDLRPQTGRFEAGAVVDTVVAGHDTKYELTTLRFEGGELLVPSAEPGKG